MDWLHTCSVCKLRLESIETNILQPKWRKKQNSYEENEKSKIKFAVLGTYIGDNCSNSSRKQASFVEGMSHVLVVHPRSLLSVRRPYSLCAHHRLGNIHASSLVAMWTTSFLFPIMGFVEWGNCREGGAWGWTMKLCGDIARQNRYLINTSELNALMFLQMEAAVSRKPLHLSFRTCKYDDCQTIARAAIAME